MKIVEYGKEHRKVVILLHGGGLSWWNYREAAELLQDRYRVLIPILDGHAGSDANFASIEQNAQRLISYIDESFGGTVDLVAGVSLGGQILAEMLAQRSDIASYALIESASVISMKLTHALIKPMMDMSWWLIKRRWFARLQFRYLRLKAELFDDYYRDSSAITKQNMLSFLQANTAYVAKEPLKHSLAKAHIYVGGKEPRQMLCSARKLHQLLPGSKLSVLKGCHHGEFSINHPQEYTETIIRILENT